MRRGQQTLFNSLFDNPAITGVLDTPVIRRGRSELLVNKRNDQLIHRYYYYIKILNRQYEATLRELENEFCIAQHTIVNAMNHHSQSLKELNAAKPGVKYFKDKYPFMVW